MSNKPIQPAHHCCGIQKRALTKALSRCDSSSQSAQERHDCYRQTARESRRQAKACLYS